LLLLILAISTINGCKNLPSLLPSLLKTPPVSANDASQILLILADFGHFCPVFHIDCSILASVVQYSRFHRAVFPRQTMLFFSRTDGRHP
jgi:hypothetical protein